MANTMILRLNQVWRLVVTGFCFALFGPGGFLLSTIWFNALPIATWDKVRRRRAARRSIAASFRLFLTVVKRLGMLDYQIEGRDILHNEQGCLVIVNRLTLIDYVLLVSTMPETDYLVKSALLENPFLGGVIRVVDYLINSQAGALLPTCQQRLEQGGTTLIFPEEARIHPGEAMTLQCGAANIAVHCSSDLRTVTINRSEQMLGKENQ